MMNVISMIVVIGLLYCVLCVPVGLFNLKVYQAVMGTKCGFPTVLLAFCPLYNIVFPRKYIYNRAPVYTGLLILFTVLMLFRTVAFILVLQVPILYVFSAFASIGAIILYYGLYLFNCFDFARMFGCGILTKLFSIVVPPLGYYLVSNQVLGYYKSVEDEVSGRFTA